MFTDAYEEAAQVTQIISDTPLTPRILVVLLGVGKETDDLISTGPQGAND